MGTEEGSLRAAVAAAREEAGAEAAWGREEGERGKQGLVVGASQLKGLEEEDCAQVDGAGKLRVKEREEEGEQDGLWGPELGSWVPGRKGCSAMAASQSQILLFSSGEPNESKEPWLEGGCQSTSMSSSLSSESSSSESELLEEKRRRGQASSWMATW